MLELKIDVQARVMQFARRARLQIGEVDQGQEPF